MPSIEFGSRFLAPAHHVWNAVIEPRGLARRMSAANLSVDTERLRVGSHLKWEIGGRFLALRCRSEIRRLEAGSGFLCEGLSGSFPRWKHRRTLAPEGEDCCVLEDRIVYDTPGGFLSAFVDRHFVRDSLLELLMVTHRSAARLAACRVLPPAGAWEPGPADTVDMPPARATAS